jgi:hypothetical protein
MSVFDLLGGCHLRLNVLEASLHGLQGILSGVAS